MAIEDIPGETLGEVVDFINNPENDIDMINFSKNAIFLGTYLPKKFGKIVYDLEQFTISLYINIKKDGKKLLIPVTITNDDFSQLSLQYV